MSQESSDRLIPRGHPVGTTLVVLHPQAYTNLMRVARITMPSETAGALLGTVTRSDGQVWVTVHDVEPVKLVPSETGQEQTLDAAAWTGLRARLARREGTGQRIVGWYYTDDNIDISRPKLDIASTQRDLEPDADLFLLVNPAQEEGAFYLWRDGSFVPTGGYYEVLPEEERPEGIQMLVVPWRGEVTGAADWLPMEWVPMESAPAGASALKRPLPLKGPLARAPISQQRHLVPTRSPIALLRGPLRLRRQPKRPRTNLRNPIVR